MPSTSDKQPESCRTPGEVWWPRFSLARCAVWVAIIVPAVFLGWVESVAFVAACSLYANAASDFAAWRADKDARLDRIEEKLDALSLALSKWHP